MGICVCCHAMCCTAPEIICGTWACDTVKTCVVGLTVRWGCGFCCCLPCIVTARTAYGLAKSADDARRSILKQAKSIGKS